MSKDLEALPEVRVGFESTEAHEMSHWPDCDPVEGEFAIDEIVICYQRCQRTRPPMKRDPAL